MRVLPILFSDERLIAVDKPAGLLSVPDPRSPERSVPEVLRTQGLEALPIHRLDREVSGLLLLAVGREALEAMQARFRARRVEKTYWGLAAGRLAEQGQFTDPILDVPGGARVSALGKPARTRFSRIAAYRSTSELELHPLTGRKNQIRIHLAHAGHPLVGERKYARGREAPLACKRVALHAWRLEVVVPWSGKKLVLEAPLPSELVELRERARAGAS